MAVDRAAASSSITSEGGDACSVAGAGHGLVRVAADAFSIAVLHRRRREHHHALQ